MDNKRLIVVSVGIVILIVVGIIAFSSIMFETKAPQFSNQVPTHWNLNDEIFVEFSDESGIRDYRVQMVFDGEILSDQKE